MGDNDNAIRNATAWMASIRDKVATYDATVSSDDGDGQDEARETIQDSALSVQVRGGWYAPGDDDKGGAPEEYEVLLTTGGPALRIVGDLGQYGEPSNARLEWQDWGTPWTEAETTLDDDKALMTFVGCFYFGEG